MTIAVSDSRLSLGISPGLTLLFAIAGGVAVGNLYWSQPLLAVIGDTFGVSISAAGLLVTVTQIGYAVGIFLVVPLGDAIDRRRLIPSIMVLSAFSLAAAAIAPSYGHLLVALASLGVLTVGGQLLSPLAGDLAAPEQRGRVVGTVASGMLTGILLSRTISGVLSDIFGWRAIFAVASMITLAVAFLLWRKVPSDQVRGSLSYGKLLTSVFSIVREHRVVRVTLLLGALVFSVFTLFWTGLTFLLSAPPFSYTLSQIGLIGIAGVTGAVVARTAGKFHDRGLSVQATGAALVLTLVSLVIAELGASSIVVILVAVVILDAAIQSINVLNQTRLLSVDPAARSRLNSVFVTSNFIGGAAGSALAGFLWPLGGWSVLMIAAAVLITVALFIWYVRRKAFIFSRA